MEILECKKLLNSEYGINSKCEIYAIHVKIDDVENRAIEMINIISSTSWISKLSAIAQRCYSARAERTIQKMVYEIFNKVSTPMSAEFGEYMVSISAQDVLEERLNHKKIPLAELFKEKVSGNPGFDFHTETPNDVLAFGEAKYSGTETPYRKALNQIVGFIKKRKDEMELVDLEKFANSKTIDNVTNGTKAYSAAFSLNVKASDKTLKSILKSKNIKPLLEFLELYLIGVEVG